MLELPPLDDLIAVATVVRIPLRVRFRGIDHREALLLRGPHGWGEFAPFLDYDDQESARWLSSALESAYAGWPAPRRSLVPVNATIPAVPAAAVESVLARYAGCTTVKVKVAEHGQRLDDDVARVAQVRQLLGPGGRIRVDANGAWSVEEATDALRRLSAYGLEYAEQPCATVDALARLRRELARCRIEVPVAADESVRRAADPLRVARAGAADLLVLKVAPLGGVAAALEVAVRVARDHALPVVVSSALDTSVGMSAGVALAAALPELPYACGLATVGLLAGDVVTRSLVPVGGVVPVGAVEPDAALLQRWQAPPQRRRWWLERLARSWRVLDDPRRVEA